MKSNLYAGTMSKVYKEALEFYREHGHFLSDKLLAWEEELSKVSHRDYTEASLVEKAGADSIYNERENSADNEWKSIGHVVEANPQAGIIVEVRNAFNQGDTLEIIPFKGEIIKIVANEIMSLTMNPITRTKPSTLIRLPYVLGAEKYNLIRAQGGK
jgi:putative protease